MIALIFIVATCNALAINVNVKEVVEGDTSAFYYNVSKNYANFSYEFYNVGSTSYKARIRLDIIKNNEIIFTAWSAERIFYPGTRKDFVFNWYATEIGNYTAKTHAYFANEVKETGSLNFEIKEVQMPEDIFNISKSTTTENYLDIVVFSTNATNNIKIIPYNIPKGWIFEQASIGKINAGESSGVRINYTASLWQPKSIDILILSEDGKYASLESVVMEKKGGMKFLLKYFSDMLNFDKIIPKIPLKF